MSTCLGRVVDDGAACPGEHPGSLEMMDVIDIPLRRTWHPLADGPLNGSQPGR